MYKRLTLSLAMLAVGAAMLAASGIASTGSAHKQSAPSGSVAKKGGILKASLTVGIENIDPQRSYYVPESQYEWLTQRPLLNFAHAQGARDRKSTRLNSSHLVISYAVFCLKKKTHTTTR